MRPFFKVMKKILALLLILIILLGGGFAGYAVMTGPVDKTDLQQIVVKIESGSGTAQIADVLAENRLIKNTTVFRINSKLHHYDGKYMAGTYGFAKNMSMDDIQQVIVQGATLAHRLTIIEGETVEKIAWKLDEQGIVSYEDFMEEEEHGEFNYDFLNGNENSLYRLEGFLYPDTYAFEPGESAHDIINQMLSHFEAVVDTSKCAEGYSFRETLIIATIIQREAGSLNDMELVSSVIHNRLDIGMALQMDSIISYILQEDRVNLTYSDIAIESDFNPYKNPGLPPGPICSPSVDAINAAMNPADTDYLYFVLSEKLDGSAFFTSDYDEFLEAKDRYYDAVKKAEQGE